MVPVEKKTGIGAMLLFCMLMKSAILCDLHLLHLCASETVALWNSLPSSVLSCTSVSSFLVSLDSHLISDRYSLGL